MLKASSGALDERHVRLGEDRGKSSAAHARAPPIDPCDRQTDRNPHETDGSFNYFSGAFAVASLH